MIRKTFIKDPNSTLDYTVLWASAPVFVYENDVEVEFIRNDGSSQDTGWLQGDVITSCAWFADEGVEIESTSFTETYATAWISGGESGKRYVVTCRITTAAGRTEDRSFFLKVEPK